GTLVRGAIPATAAVTAMNSQLWSTVTVMTAALAATSPTETGTRPAWTACRQVAFSSRRHSRSATTVKIEEGPNTAMVVTSIPAQPATFQPTSGATIMLGPGAAWASA